MEETLKASYACGIDPGLSGAIAVVDGTNILYLADIPIKIKKEKSNKNKKIIDGVQLSFLVSDLLKQYPEISRYTVLEKAQPMHSQGIVSTFTNGFIFGQILQCFVDHEISVNIVYATSWKKKFNLLLGNGYTKKEKKEKTYRFIASIYDDCSLLLTKSGKLKDGRSDAVAIAHYGLVTHAS